MFEGFLIKENSENKNPETTTTTTTTTIPLGPGVGSIQDPQPKKLTPGPPQNKKSIKNPSKIP